MKQKTPLQQAIAELQKQRDGIDRILDDPETNTNIMGLAGKKNGLEHAVHILLELLPTEQQVIEDAFNDGWIADFPNSKHYFTSKFEQ